MPLPPNVDEERRWDVGSRKVIEHVHQLRLQTDEILKHIKVQDIDLESIKKDVASAVTYKWLITIAGGFALAVLGVAWGMQERALKSIDENRQTREAQILQLRQENTATSVRIESKVDGLFKHLIEGMPKSSVRAEVRAEEEKAAEPLPTPLVSPAPTRRR